MNTNRQSYPPGYGSYSSSQRHGVFSTTYPSRKQPYYTPQIRGEDHKIENSAMGLGSQSSSTPRKRVNVACARCRKRKIKCSGDPGDNMGCQNCKVAGVSAGQCLFLRVQCQQLVINENQSPSGSYDTLGQQIYGNIAAQYACLSAPPMINGDFNFKNQLQMQRAIAEPPYASLHPSKSLPTLTKRSPHAQVHQNIPQSPEESGLALLARNAEAVSNISGPSGATYELATTTAIENLTAVAAPSFTHWSSSPTTESLRPSVNSNSVNFRSGCDEIETTKSYSMTGGLSTPLYFDTTYTQAAAPQIASTMGLLPTSNVRSNSFTESYGYSHLANISSGVSHMTLALPTGKGAVPSPQSLQSEKCETSSTQPDVPYNMGFTDQSEGSQYPSRFSRAVTQVLSSPIDPYNISASSSGVNYRPHSDLDIAPASKSIADTGDLRQTQNSLVRVPAAMVIMNQAMQRGLSTPRGHTTQRKNSTNLIERQDLMSPPVLPISRPMQVPAPMIRTSSNRPSSAGCGSSIGSPRFGYETIQYGDPSFTRSMKASH